MIGRFKLQRPTRTFVVTAAGLLGLATSTTHADQSQDVERSAMEIRELLERRHVERSTFPQHPSSFLASEYDPLLLVATWEKVRKQVRRILERNLDVQLYDDSLEVYVATVSECPLRYRMIFVEYEPKVRQSLSRALSLPDECLPDDWKPVFETRTVALSSLTVPWNEIDTVTSEFASESDAVSRLGFSIQAPVRRDDKIQLVTSWLGYGTHGGYDCYWRLFFQVKREVPRDRAFITVRGQVARNLPGAETDQMEYLGSEEFDNKFEVAITPDGTTYKVRRFVPQKPNPSPMPEDPIEKSTSGQLAKSLLREYVELLTR